MGVGTDPILILDGAEAHHAAVVLRVRPGEAATVLDGAGTEWGGTIHRVEKRRVELRLTERRQHPARPGSLHLAVALLKGRAWDMVLEKATELGATSIQPLAAERCVVRIPEVEADAKLAGWRATTIAAAKQCGTPWLPVIGRPRRPFEWLAGPEIQQRNPADEPLLVASLEPGTDTIRRAVIQSSPEGHPRAKRVTLVVGPEGDFTPAEYAEFRAVGAKPVSLGPLVLRADTAVIAGLAVLQAVLAEATAVVSSRAV